MPVSFLNFTPEDYARFMEHSIPEYANDLLAATGCTAEEAAQMAADDFDNILTEGFQTPGNYFYKIQNESKEDVGYLWYMMLNPSQAYICDFCIYDTHRRKGYASAALTLLEQYVRELGCGSILLNVFDHNTAGIKLYEKCGYALDTVHEAGSRYLIKKLE